MTTAYTVETEPSERVPATGTLPALRTIVLRRSAAPPPSERAPLQAAVLPGSAPLTLPPTLALRRYVQQSPRGATPSLTFDCAICGKTVTARGLSARFGRRYCSKPCREKAHILRRAARWKAEGRPPAHTPTVVPDVCSVCIVCSRISWAKQHRLYCDAVCRGKARNARRAAHRVAAGAPRPDRPCVICRGLIPPPAPGRSYQRGQRTCSDDCRRVVEHARDRARRARQRAAPPLEAQA